MRFQTAADPEREVDIYRLVQQLHEQGLRTPCLLRFLDIVGDRIARLNVSCVLHNDAGVCEEGARCLACRCPRRATAHAPSYALQHTGCLCCRH